LRWQVFCFSLTFRYAIMDGRERLYNGEYAHLPMTGGNS